jgi:hypothetical protein
MAERALLVLIGGRQIPNLLTAQALKPDFIVPIASHEALRDNGVWTRIKPVLERICPRGVADPTEHTAFRVDAFDPEAVRQAVRQAIGRHPSAEWIFNITCATTIMSIGAYEVGIERGVSIWYLDTATRRIVTLAGQPPERNLYKVTVEHYMAAYGRRVILPKTTPTLQAITFAKDLAQQPDEAMRFREALRKGKANEGKQDQPREVVLQSASAAIKSFCDLAQSALMMDSYRVHPNQILRCQLPNNKLWKFMEGQWLEIYTWVSAHEAQVFDDYQLDVCIPVEHPDESSSNELDLALTHEASLLIAECKCEVEPSKTEHLTKLRAIANMVGGNFVGCIFITAQPSSAFPGDKNKHGSFEHFCSQARAHQVVVVPGENLADLKEIFLKEAGAKSTERPDLQSWIRQSVSARSRAGGRLWS